MFSFFSEVDQRIDQLIEASMSGNLQLVKKLVEDGVNVNALDEYGNTALSQSAFKGQLEIVIYLLNKQPSLYSKNVALLLACQAGNKNVIDELLKYGAQVNIYIEDYHTPLFQVIVGNKMEAFERLLEEKEIDINLEDKEGVIPLLLAAYNGRLEMVKKLIDKGASIDITNKKGLSAKSMASLKKHEDIVNYLESKENELKM